MFLSVKEIFREVLLFIFVLCVFANLFFDKALVALVFAVLIVGLQIERVADKND